MKNIYLKQDEEIISVIDKLINSKGDSVNLFIPLGAQIWQSSINLKLLKREADNLEKEVNLIVSDDLGAEMAEKIGFSVKKEADFPVETIGEEDNEELDEDEDEDKELEIVEVEEEPIQESEVEVEEVPEEVLEEENRDMIDFLVDELKPEGKVASTALFFKKEDKKENKEEKIISTIANSEESRKRMADIINPRKNVQSSFLERNFFKRKPEQKIIKKTVKKEEIKISQKPKQDVFLNNENERIEDHISEEYISTKSFKWAKFLIIFIIIAFLIASLVGYLVLPKAEVVVYPKYENMDFDLSVVGSKEISQVDISLNKIPIQEIEVSKTASKEFESTGEKQLNEKAKGFVTVYNGYSSSPQVLVATTRFESSNGKIFRISDKITIPGAEISEGKIIASSIEVEIFADEPGESYNIDASDFTIPGFKGSSKYAGFYAQSKSPMTGGSTGKIKVVSSEDLENAEKSLSEEIKNEVMQAFEDQIPTDLKMIDSSLTEDIVIISTVKEEAKTDTFTLEIKAVVKALLFKEKDIKNLIDLNVISMIPEGKEPISKTQKIEWGEPVIDDENDEILFDLKVEENVAWKIDTISLKEELAGLDEIEVRKYLSNQIKIQESKVSFWPFWVNHIPKQKEKINITIDCKD